MACGFAPRFTWHVGAIAYRVSRAVRRGGGRQLLALTLVVALASGLVLTLAAGASRTLTTPDRYNEFRGDVLGASVQQGSGPARTEEITALPAVKSAQLATFLFAGLVRPDGDEPLDTLVFAGSYEAFGTLLTGGRAPDPAVPGEFVANPEFLRDHHAELGDTFQGLSFTQAQGEVAGFDAGQPEGPTWEATLVGVIDGPASIEDDTPITMFSSSLFSLGDIGTSASVGLIELKPGSTVEDLRAQLDGLPGGSELTLDPLVWVPDTVRAAVDAEGQGLVILAFIVAAAMVVVVGQLLSRQVRLPDAERLAVNALGMTRSQVLADSVGRAAVPVALGVILGALIAYLASDIFPLGFIRRAEPHPGLLADPLVHGGGAVVLSLVILVWVLVTRGSADRRVEGVRRLGIVDRLAPVVRPAAAATGLRFAFSRSSRDSGSILGSVIGLVLVIGVLIGALTFGMNLDRLIDEPRRTGTNYDAGIGQGGQEIPPEVQSRLVDSPDVTRLTLYGTRTWSIGVDSFDVTGMDQVKGTLGPLLLSGTGPTSARDIVLGRVAARHFDKKVGDTLEIEGPEGSVDFQVTGIAVVPGIDGGDGMGEGGVVTIEGMRRIDPAVSFGTAAIGLRPGASPATLAELHDELDVAIGPPDRPSVIRNLDRVRWIPFVVAGALGLLALLSIAHQLILSASRRRHDVAVLRALGVDRRWVTGVMHWQASFFALVVAVLAVPVGIAAGRTVFRIFVEHLGALDDVGQPVLNVVATMLGLVVLANVVVLLPARRARRERPAVALLGE